MFRLKLSIVYIKEAKYRIHQEYPKDTYKITLVYRFAQVDFGKKSTEAAKGEGMD